MGAEEWFDEDAYEYVGAHRWPEQGEHGHGLEAWRQRRSWRRHPASRVMRYPNYTPQHLMPDLGVIEFTINAVTHEQGVPLYIDQQGRATLYPVEGLRIYTHISHEDAAKLRAKTSMPFTPPVRGSGVSGG